MSRSTGRRLGLFAVDKISTMSLQEQLKAQATTTTTTTTTTAVSSGGVCDISGISWDFDAHLATVARYYPKVFAVKPQKRSSSL